MNYFLVMNNHPPITIHQEDRKDYYAALEVWDERQEPGRMEAFLREQTVQTWKKQIERNKMNWKEFLKSATNTLNETTEDTVMLSNGEKLKLKVKVK